MNYGKYIIYLVFLVSFFQFVGAQDNSDSSSDGIKFSSTKEKKKSLLKPLDPKNPFLKKLNSKDKENFFKSEFHRLAGNKSLEKQIKMFSKYNVMKKKILFLKPFSYQLHRLRF